LKLFDPEIADAAFEELVKHGRDVDHLARQLERQGLARPLRSPRVGPAWLLDLLRVLPALLAKHGDLDLGVRSAAHLLDDLLERLADHVLTVDGDDLIAALDPSAVRGRALDRRDDDELVAAPVDLEPDAAELALGVALELPPLLGRQVRRVGVE